MSRVVNDKGRIPIVFSTDNNYAFCTYVALISIIKNTRTQDILEFYILIDNSFTEENRKIIEKAEDLYHNVITSFLTVDVNFYKQIKVNYDSRITIATYYRLFISEILSDIDKCIYLDSDIIVELDIEKMYKIDIADNYIAGVRDAIVQEEMEIYKDYADKLGIVSMDTYMNAGILVMNLKKIREEKLYEKFLIHIDRNYDMADQDILNVCCYGKIQFLPLKYNLPKRFYNRFYKLEKTVIADEEIKEIKRGNMILHFSEMYKPWDSVRCRGQEIWWHYARMTVCTEILEKIAGEADKYSIQKDAQYLYKLVKDKKNIVIFGYSDIGKRVCDFLLEIHVDVLCFCDNDVNKQGKSYRGLDVLPIEKVYRDEKDIFVINTSQRYSNAVNIQLKEIGIFPENIFVYKNKNKLYYISLIPELYEQELGQVFLEEYGIAPGNMTWSQMLARLKENINEILKQKYFFNEWLQSYL